MSVNTHLADLASNLVLTSSENLSIQRSIATLSTRLNTYFGSNVSNHFQFGSSTRGTILPRKADNNSDIDYMVVFDTSDGTKKPQAYLDRLRKFSSSMYSTSEVAQSHPTIVLSLNHIKFELVPATYSYFSGYQIPSPKSSWSEWINTDPDAINQSLIDKNKDEKYQIKPLVRLVKYWNASQGHPFSSYELEQYIIQKSFWFCTSLKDYFYSFWSGFNCDYGTPQYIIDKVSRAKKHADQAKEYEDDCMPCSAEAEIKKIVPSL